VSDPVQQALALLLGLAEGAAPCWERVASTESTGMPGLLVDLGRIGAGPLQIELRDPDADPAPWVRGPLVGLSYRADDSDPLDDPVRRRALARIAQRLLRIDGRERLQPLLDALAADTADRPTRLRGRLDTIRSHFEREGSDLWCHPEGTLAGGRATLRLGFRCNQRCRFCWQGRDWPDAPAARWRQDVDRLASQGIEYLTITGGEPTLYRYLPELIALATSRSLCVHLQTNAIRLADPAYLARLVDAGLRSLLVSLHSHDPAISDRMTGAPGSHEPTVVGTRAAVEAGLEVQINVVVERANLASLPLHAAFLVDLSRSGGLMGVILSHPTNYFDRAHWERSVVPLDEVRAPLLEACRVLMSAGVTVDPLGTCGFPSCVVAGIPELLRPVPPGDLDTDGRLYGDACDGCKLRAGCIGLRREYVDVHGERGLTPV
jgi:pyruvate-formate lyase-activating enzyme